MSVGEEYFDLIPNLSILEVALDQAVVYINISGTFWKECLQKHVGWHEQLLLVVYKLHRTVSVTHVVQSHCLSKHIIAHASHLHGVWSEEFATVNEAASFKSHWIVSLVHDEHTNQTLISIYDEVATKLMRIFLSLNKKLFGEAGQVAVLRSDHDWNLTNANVYFLWVLVVYAATQRGV